MRQSIGTTFMLNIIIIFIVLVFAFLAATLSYAKAFRVNSKIVNYLEVFEGYNDLSKKEIDRTLKNLGYGASVTNTCSKTKTVNNNPGKLVKLGNENYAYCVYYFENDGDNKYYSYGVQTYMYLELPILGRTLKLPVFTKTNRLFYFSNTGIQQGQ